MNVYVVSHDTSTTCKTTSIDEEYRKVLKMLFQPALFQTRNLFTLNHDTTKSIFNERKEFFNRLFEAKYCSNRKVPKIIHVTGTKGKGSVVEYIGCGLQNAGFKVGIFTSPHIHTSRERIKINHSLISKEDFVRHGLLALENMKEIPWVGFFDLLVYMSISYFSEQDVDYIVFEAGIGGRYTSTNFMSDPAAAIITNISLDHQSILGNSISSIAWHKAGIIQYNTHVFTPLSQPAAAMEVIENECQIMQSKLHKSEAIDTREFQFKVQRTNESLARDVLIYLGVINIKFSGFFWPCRMERFKLNNTSIIIDGCHNGESVEVFLQEIANMRVASGMKLISLFGAGMEKCLDDMLASVLKYSDSIIMIQSKHFKSLSEEKLIEIVKQNFGEMNSNRIIHQFNDISIIDFETPCSFVKQGTLHNRLSWAIDNFAGSYIVVFGSLFAASDAREGLFR